MWTAPFLLLVAFIHPVSPILTCHPLSLSLSSPSLLSLSSPSILSLSPLSLLSLSPLSLSSLFSLSQVVREAHFTGQSYLNMKLDQAPGLKDNFYAGVGFRTEQKEGLMFYHQASV